MNKFKPLHRPYYGIYTLEQLYFTFCDFEKSIYYYFKKVLAQFTSQEHRDDMKRRRAMAAGLELKYIDYEYLDDVSTTVSGSVSDPAGVDSISAIDVGDSPTTRDGRQATLMDVQINGYVKLPPLVAGNAPRQGGIVRIALVLDTQTNGAQLDPAALANTPSNSDLEVLAFPNLETGNRFITLDYKVIDCNPTAEVVKGNNYDSPVNFWNFVLSFDDLKVKANYTGPGAGVSTITDNSLHVVAIASDSNSLVQLGYISRVRFF